MQQRLEQVLGAIGLLARLDWNAIFMNRLVTSISGASHPLNSGHPIESAQYRSH